MKYKLILIFGLIALCSTARAQEVDMYYANDLNSRAYLTGVSVGLPITWKQFAIKPYGGWETWAERKLHGRDGQPFRDKYTYGIRLQAEFNGVTFYSEAERFCWHNVESPSTARYQTDVTKWGYQMTTIRFGFKTTFHTWRLD